MNIIIRHVKGPFIVIRQTKQWANGNGGFTFIFPYTWSLACRFCPEAWLCCTTDHQVALAEAQEHLDRHWDGWKYTPQIGTTE